MGYMPWNRYQEVHSPYVDAALLLVRLGVGGLMAGHGAQKLFGWFGGHGLKGTGMWMESMGLKPGKMWALAASGGEMGGGLLMALGLGGPLGPLGITSAMTMATAKAHWGKPIWVSEGGAELPVTYITTAAAVALAGPGRYSLDHFFGIKLHWSIPAVLTMLAATTLAYGMTREAPAQPAQEPAEQLEETSEDEHAPAQIGERRREEQRAA